MSIALNVSRMLSVRFVCSHPSPVGTLRSVLVFRLLYLSTSVILAASCETPRQDARRVFDSGDTSQRFVSHGQVSLVTRSILLADVLPSYKVVFSATSVCAAKESLDGQMAVCTFQSARRLCVPMAAHYPLVFASMFTDRTRYMPRRIANHVVLRLLSKSPVQSESPCACRSAPFVACLGKVNAQRWWPNK